MGSEDLKASLTRIIGESDSYHVLRGQISNRAQRYYRECRDIEGPLGQLLRSHAQSFLRMVVGHERAQEVLDSIGSIDSKSEEIDEADECAECHGRGGHGGADVISDPFEECLYCGGTGKKRT